LTKEECKYILECNYDRLPPVVRHMVEQLIKEHFDPQSYKLEDLKECINKPIYDSKFCRWGILCKIYNRSDGLILKIVFSDKYGTTILFIKYEENRFFPVQMVNVGCE